MSAAKTSAPASRSIGHSSRSTAHMPVTVVLTSAAARSPTISLVSLVVSKTHTPLSMSSVSARSGRMKSHELGGLSRIIMHPDFRFGMRDEPSGRVYSQWSPFFAMVTAPGIELQVLTLFAQCGSGH